MSAQEPRPKINFSFRFLFSLFGDSVLVFGMVAANPLLKGVAAFLDDERKDVLIEICEFLKENYFQYGRAICYLEQLAGARAMPRKPPQQLDFLLVPQVAVQRGAIVLGNLEPHTLHTMRVTFHRFH